MTDIINLITGSFQYPFMQKALAAGCFIALSSSILGVFLVLKRFSLIGDGLAHVSFASVTLALLLSFSPIIFSIPVVIIASFIIIRLNERSNVYQDAAIGLLSSAGIALGIMFASISKGFNIDLYSYLFGSILAIRGYEVVISVVLSTLVILTVFVFYRPLLSLTFDQDFAKSSGVNASLINYILITLTSINIVIGIRVVGTMLISSLIIFPAVSALQVSRSFIMTILLSVIISVLSVILGILISIIFNLPAGASIVLINAVFFITMLLINKLFRIK